MVSINNPVQAGDKRNTVRKRHVTKVEVCPRKRNIIFINKNHRKNVAIQLKIAINQ